MNQIHHLNQTVVEVRDRHLKKFRSARGADSKALYQKRLTDFVEELLESLSQK